MADYEEALDELQKRLDESQRKNDAVGKEIDREDKAIHPPKSVPDHDNKGGVI